MRKATCKRGHPRIAGNLKGTNCKLCVKIWKDTNVQKVLSYRKKSHQKPGKPPTPSPVYSRLYLKQIGLCAICEARPVDRRLALDHDHRTGVIRGLLCLHCNVGLGLFRDDPVRLAMAINYLKK